MGLLWKIQLKRGSTILSVVYNTSIWADWALFYIEGDNSSLHLSLKLIPNLLRLLKSPQKNPRNRKSMQELSCFITKPNPSTPLLCLDRNLTFREICT